MVHIALDFGRISRNSSDGHQRSSISDRDFNKNYIRTPPQNLTDDFDHATAISNQTTSILQSTKLKDITDVNTSNITSTNEGGQKVNNTISIVIQLMGEMGNNLGSLAHGYALAWELEDLYGIQASVWLRHQERAKWVRGRDSLKRCFPVLAALDFERGNTENFHLRSEDSTKLGLPPNNLNVSDLAKFALNNEVVPESELNPSVPFIHTAKMVGYASMAYPDKYLDRYKELFRYDDENPLCCNPEIQPEPDEAVFHFRNFKREMPRVYKRLGFQELGPNQTAIDLFGNYKAGDKVAIVTRFGDDKDANSLADKLRGIGLTVRLIAGNSGEQDFCFLKNTKKEIIGTYKSTFLFWAGILGETEKVHVYTMENPRNVQGYPKSFQSQSLNERFVFSEHSHNSTLDPNWRRRN